MALSCASDHNPTIYGFVCCHCAPIQEDLRGIVAYARSRAVRVVVEIEMPGHGSFSAGMPQLSLSSCADVLDVTKDAT